MSQMNNSTDLSAKTQDPEITVDCFDESTFSHDLPQTDWRWITGEYDGAIGVFDASNLEVDFEPWLVVTEESILEMQADHHRMHFLAIHQMTDQYLSQKSETQLLPKRPKS